MAENKPNRQSLYLKVAVWRVFRSAAGVAFLNPKASGRVAGPGQTQPVLTPSEGESKPIQSQHQQLRYYGNN